MRRYFNFEAISIGLAMFSMFFGAGNIIYPLAIGQFAGDKNFFAIIGLLLTAALMPIAGVIAMILYEGKTKEFFGRIGRIPGFLLALIMITLLGPLGSTPRCIMLSYTTLKSTFLPISPILFSAMACVLIFVFTIRKNYILTLLGWVLTPVLLASLATIIIAGIIMAPEAPHVVTSNFDMFMHGLQEGYNTMDLLAAFFFSSTILHLLRERTKASQEGNQPSSQLKTLFTASVVGVSLLSLVYIGFSYLASFYSETLQSQGKDALLSEITFRIAGPYAGFLVCVTIAFACFTTAIALISSFTDFIQKEVFKEKIPYGWILFGALLITFFVSTFEFNGISAFLWPILQVCYPGLIVLTFLNLFCHLKKMIKIKVPVIMTFAISSIFYFVL
jgi:LIVCS family branched-chain amino acid:cation transporter